MVDSPLKMRVVDMRWVRAGDLLPHPDNWREHGQGQKEAFAAMMDGVGFAGSLLTFTTSDGDLMLIDGHLRADQHPDEMLPTLVTDLDEDEARQLLATHDPMAALATANAAKIKALHAKFKHVNARRQKFLKKIRESHGVVLDEEKPPDDPGAQVDKAEELREKWQTETGQLWVIPSVTGKGEHKILCGDSTNADDVARLMDGVTAQGAFTSPPYAEQRKAQYGGTPADEYVGWWDGVQSCVRNHLKEDGSFFVNIKAHCEDGERVLYVMDLVLAMRRRWNWRFVDELCWLRRGFPGDFKIRFRNAFEPVYHFAINKHILFNPQNVLVESSISRGHSPSKSSWNNQSGSGLPGVDYASVDARPSNVIDIKRSAYGHSHPAMFPIELPKFFIEGYSDNNDLWYDPFLGSGTAIAACEQTGRVGYGMEISEAYTAVCLQRLADMGLEPRRAIE